MAKRKKGKSGSGADQYVITAFNLAKKGKTNKKLKRNPNASKHETVRNKEIKEAAIEYVKLHPPGSGRRSKRKQQQQ